MDFLSVDVETPNTKNNSICAMGITFFRSNAIVFSRMITINPEVPFSRSNVALHGISQEIVSQAPTFDAVWSEYVPYFRHYPVVMHNCSFDTSVLQKVARRYDIALPPMDVYCTMRLYKHNYPELGSYSLDALCDRFGIHLDHHRCDSDSLAAAKLMILLLEDERTEIFSSNAYCYLPGKSDPAADEDGLSSQASSTAVFLRGGSGVTAMPELSYSQEPVVFTDKRFCITGEVDGFSRQQVIDAIQERQGVVTSSVSKRTDYLIVGREDIGIVGQQAKSSKIVAAEALVASGCPIRIIDASRFLDALAQP